MCSVCHYDLVDHNCTYIPLLFLWQWLVRVPRRWKIFKWTRSTKLNAVVSTYHEPYTTESITTGLACYCCEGDLIHHCISHCV